MIFLFFFVALCAIIRKVYLYYRKRHFVCIQQIKGSNTTHKPLVIVADTTIYKIIQEYMENFIDKYDKVYRISYDGKCTNAALINRLVDSIPQPADVLFVYRIVPGVAPPSKSFFLNTEQLSRSNSLTYVKSLPGHLRLLDYSYENVRIAKEHGLISTYTPITVYNTHVPKTRGVAFIGSLKNARRRQIYDELRGQGVDITNVTGFGVDRDAVVYQHRILLNIHADRNYTVFEELRCTPCVLNEMLIVTETCSNMDGYPYRDRVIEAPYDELVATVCRIVKELRKRICLV